MDTIKFVEYNNVNYQNLKSDYTGYEVLIDVWIKQEGDYMELSNKMGNYIFIKIIGSYKIMVTEK